MLLMMQVAGCCGRRQGDLTDLSAQGGDSCLDWGKGRGERGGELGGELGLVPSSPHLFLLTGRGGGRGGRGRGRHTGVGGRQCASPVLSVLWRSIWVGGWGGHFVLQSGNDCDGQRERKRQRGGRERCTRRATNKGKQKREKREKNEKQPTEQPSK